MAWDDRGRPRPPGDWGGTAIPKPGTYRVRLVRDRDFPWMPASIAWEQTTDPEGRVCDRWAPVLRILGWAWFRGELIEWESSLHPIPKADFDILAALPVPAQVQQFLSRR